AEIAVATIVVIIYNSSEAVGAQGHGNIHTSRRVYVRAGPISRTAATATTAATHIHCQLCCAVSYSAVSLVIGDNRTTIRSQDQFSRHARLRGRGGIYRCISFNRTIAVSAHYIMEGPS